MAQANRANRIARAPRRGRCNRLATAAALLIAVPAAPFQEPWNAAPSGRFREIWPVNSAADAALTAELGGGFAFHHSDHFSVAHANDESGARYRAEILESVYAAFTAFFSESGVELALPDALLPVVLFPTRFDFFAHAGEGLPDDVSGLYLAGPNRAYFYEGGRRKEATEMLRRAHHAAIQHARLRRWVETWPDDEQVPLQHPDGRTRLYTKPGALREIAKDARRIAEEASRYREAVGQESIETMIHEGVHLLTFNMGVLQRGEENPIWLVEGLATYFEPSAHGYLLEPGSVHWRRLDQLRRQRSRGRRIELERMLRDDGLFRVGDSASDAYDSAWGLVHYLAAAHRAGLADYLRLLSDPAARRPAARIATFERAFGAPLADLERQCLAYLEALRPASGEGTGEPEEGAPSSPRSASSSSRSSFAFTVRRSRPRRRAVSS